jgi:BMFP domain-containing protein YqiC
MYIYLYSHNPKYNGIEKSLRANQMSYIEEEQITQWHREEFEGQSDVVYRGRTDNTMANRKSTK